VSAIDLSPSELRFPLRPGRGEVALHATGFRHPRRRFGRADHFTAYTDLTHLQLGARFARIATRRGVFALPRADFVDPHAPEALLRALLERVATAPGGAAQLATMAEVEETFGRRPGLRATPLAAALCAAVYALGLVLGPVVHHVGLMSPMLAAAGEPWRLVTANFLHAFPLHLAMGILGLLVIGALVERPLGALRTVVVLGLSGLVATASAWPAGYDELVGASGLVAGLAGAALWLELRRPERLPASWRLPRRLFVAALAADALLPIALPMIAGWAHVAGFLAGGTAAALVGGARLGREPLRPAVALASALIGLVTAIALAGAGRLLVGATAWEAHAQRLLTAQRPPPVLMNDAAWLIATAHTSSGRALADALELAERAVRATRRRDPNLLDTLAEAQFRAGDAEAAVETIDEAITLAPEEPYFREQRRRFVGERAPDDRPPPPTQPWLPPDADPSDPFETGEPGVPI
jgi:membrane associated rhomboid family serine protease